MGDLFSHFDKFDDFNSKKLSANEENTQYTIGVDGAVTSGSPDIPWDKICWVKDKQKIWTHGKLYNCSPIPTNVSQLTNDSGYITSVAKGTATTQATAQTLMCDVNINGKTVTPVKFNGTVGSSTMPVYMAGGKPTPIISFGEANLSWGGKNHTGSYGPIDAALVDVLRANRFDGLPAECITVEYSRDGGATWVDYGATDKQKVDMVSQTADNAILYIGKNDTDNPVNVNHKLRVIINSWKANNAASVYTRLEKFVILISSSSSSYNNTCTIKTRTRGDYLEGNDTWKVVKEALQVDGWSGYNVIPCTISPLGANNPTLATSVGEIMFEFSIGNPPSSGVGLTLYKIFAYGGVGLATPSNMAAGGHLYSYDYQQNAKFPAKVNAVGGLQENGTNISAKYLGINAAAKSISDGTNSYTPSAIKTMETNLEDVISDVVSIDTSLFPTSTDEVIGFRQTNGGDGVGYSEAWLDRLKGNTVVWNQLADMSKFNAYSGAVNNITVVNDGKKITVTNTAYEGKGGDNVAILAISKTAIGHKILVSLNATFSNSSHYVLIEYGANSIEIRDGNNDGIYEAIYTATKEKTVMLFKAAGQKTIGDTWTFSNIKVIDLTQMFGAGNEPTTIEEFNARKPLGVSDDYNEGELISTTADELKSVGFNAWDEQWERGSLHINAGSNDNASTNSIRSKGYIKVLSNTTYFAKTPQVIQSYFVVVEYDENKSFIRHIVNGSANKTFTTSSNCRYIRFRLAKTNQYNHDICIHLVHTGTRNGQYEPYKEYRLQLPIKDIKDKDGSQLFPNGLLSAGTAYDEITATKAIKRIGVTPLNLTAKVGNTFYHTSVRGMKILSINSRPNILCDKYVTEAPVAGKSSDKCISVSVGNRDVFVNDSSCSTIEEIQAATQGVMLYYELAEPIEVDIEEWDRRYEVSDFGTEEVISDTPTAPLKADIIYEYNAKGRIEANERGIEELNGKVDEINEKVGEMNGLSISADKIWSEENPVDITLGDVDNDAFLPEGYGLAGGQSRVARMYVKFTSTATTYEGEFMSSYNDNCLIIGVKGYYELTAPNGTMLKRGYLGDSFVKVEQIGNSGWKFDFAALDMEEGMKVHVGAMLDCIDID